jgi:hypothetical protein
VVSFNASSTRVGFMKETLKLKKKLGNKLNSDMK